MIAAITAKAIKKIRAFFLLKTYSFFSGLAERIMLVTLSKVGTSTRKIVFSFMAIGVALSMWVTDMAVAAMLLPLGITILQASGAQPLKSNFGRALMRFKYSNQNQISQWQHHQGCRNTYYHPLRESNNCICQFLQIPNSNNIRTTTSWCSNSTNCQMQVLLC